MTDGSPVIDAHTHLYSTEMAPPYWLRAMASYGSSISERTPEFVRQRMERDWFDPGGDRLIADMDDAGIDKSVVFVLDFGLYAGVDDSVSLERRYELFAGAVKRHSDRLVLFGGIDPRRPDAVSFIRRAVEEHNIRGVKIWPPAGAYPNEAYCYRLYELCAELQLPLVVHTGQEIGPLRSECTRPMFVDQPANDFPEVTFVLAHAGMGWWEEAAEIAWHHPNVYVDIAYWQAKYLRSEERFVRELRDLVSTAGAGRVLFGTDWPALRTVGRVNPKKWVEVLRGLADEGRDGPSFTTKEIDLLLGGVAAKALKL